MVDEELLCFKSTSSVSLRLMPYADEPFVPNKNEEILITETEPLFLRSLLVSFIKVSVTERSIENTSFLSFETEVL